MGGASPPGWSFFPPASPQPLGIFEKKEKSLAHLFKVSSE